MVSSDFHLLKVDDNNDNSTDNLKRKYEKLLKSYNHKVFQIINTISLFFTRIITIY